MSEAALQGVLLQAVDHHTGLSMAELKSDGLVLTPIPEPDGARLEEREKKNEQSVSAVSRESGVR